MAAHRRSNGAEFGGARQNRRGLEAIHPALRGLDADTQKAAFSPGLRGGLAGRLGGRRQGLAPGRWASLGPTPTRPRGIDGGLGSIGHIPVPSSRRARREGGAGDGTTGGAVTADTTGAPARAGPATDLAAARFQ